MNSSLNDRIRHARERMNLSLTEVAQRIGLHVSSVWQWESGRAAPSSTNLRKLASLLRVSLDWLGSDESTLEEIGTREPDGTLLIPLRARGGGPLVIGPGAPREGYLRLPLLDVAAAAGTGTAHNADFPEVLEWINVAEWRAREWLGMIPREGRVRLLTVRGDSMEPHLKNGDVVAIDTECARFEGDGVYLITQWEQLRIKRLQLMRDGLHLISDNTALYKSEIVPQAELDTVHICGRILGALSFRRSGEI